MPFSVYNNALFCRLDAKKLLRSYRRPVPQNARDIGIWKDIMGTLTQLAVVTNAFIIAVTSDFIPRTVYQWSYSPDGSLAGYVNFTLSTFNTSELDLGKAGAEAKHNWPLDGVCRYQANQLAML